jgi:catechol 2,3-dioxygenase-like lactoylglutathione lyase family enzyme
MNTATKTLTQTAFHLALHVSDLDRSVAFYRDLLGIEPDKLHTDYARFTLADPPLVLSLNPVNQRASGPQSVSHLGIRGATPAWRRAAHERLTAAGATLREEHATTCCYAVQDKLWATDPDGNEWEVYEVLADVGVKDGSGSTCCAR